MLLTVFALSAATAEANQCKDLFFHDPFKGQVISERLNALFWKSTEKMAMSTTGARIEKKWTVETTKLSENLAAFGENLATIGLEIKLRDQKKLGSKNITDTIYLEKIQVRSQNKKMPLSLKIRVRKYGYSPESSVNYKVEYAEFTKNHSFIEFKVPDSRYNGAVFKPRLYMPDVLIQQIGTSKFIKNFKQITKTALELNVPKYADEVTVKSMLEAIKIALEEKVSFKKIAENIYARDSYSITFFDSKTNRSFDVQMTLDQNISMKLLSENKTIEAYKPTDSVIEIKIPTEYSSLKLDQDLSLIKGYQIFLEFVAVIEKTHDKNYEAGRGKNFHAHRSYINEHLNEMLHP